MNFDSENKIAQHLLKGKCKYRKNSKESADYCFCTYDSQFVVYNMLYFLKKNVII